MTANEIQLVQAFVAKQEMEFSPVLRMNQLGGRYEFIDAIISPPRKKSKKYEGAYVLGLFYLDKKPVEGPKYKQDLVFKFPTGEYTFVIDSAWFTLFPALQNHRFVMKSSEFRGEMGGGKYGIEDSHKRFNHHYEKIGDLPNEIAEIAKRRGYV